MSAPRLVAEIPRPPAGSLVITEQPGGDVRVEARRGDRGRPRSVDVHRNELAPVAQALAETAAQPPMPPLFATAPPPREAPPPPVEVARVMLWCGRPGDLRWLRAVRVVVDAPGSERACVEASDGRDPERWIVPTAVNVSRGAFEALETAALAAAPEGSRAGVADALRRWADAATWPNGRDDWGRRAPTEPRTLREYWAVMPESGATLASPDAVEAARAAPRPEQPARPVVDAARAAAELARNRALDEADARRRAHAASVADAKTGRRPLALRATAAELAAAARARAEFAALPPDEQRKAAAAARARSLEEQAAWDAVYAAAYAAAVEDDLRRVPLRPSTGAPADAPAAAPAPPGSR